MKIESERKERPKRWKKVNHREVYVLMHNKEMTFSGSELAKIEHWKEKHHLQDQKEIYVDGKMGNGLEQQEHDDIEESENPESGALWDIYHTEDALKFKEYLRKHFRESRPTYCLSLKQAPSTGKMIVEPEKTYFEENRNTSNGHGGPSSSAQKVPTSSIISNRN
ncbi:lysine-specific demethylase JMJ26-like isoform X2 [Daucus carota subsp. sativus]|uniref:lysine-specific demethylase JMJ26-like isoform X2 n=1 Tax=Daucus carota subsp. sativus TaxID=79200 RepID=UPI0030832D14